MTTPSVDQVHRPHWSGVWNEDLLEVAQFVADVRRFVERSMTGALDRVKPVTVVTGAYSILASDRCVVVQDTVTVTLPTAVGKNGMPYTVKRETVAGAVTVATTGSETIDGSATYSLSTNYDAVTVVSDGSNWLSM